MLCCNPIEGMLFQLFVSPYLIDRIPSKLYEDKMVRHIRENVRSREGNTENEWGGHINGKGISRINNRIYVPNVDGLG